MGDGNINPAAPMVIDMVRQDTPFLDYVPYVVPVITCYGDYNVRIKLKLKSFNTLSLNDLKIKLIIMLLSPWTIHLLGIGTACFVEAVQFRSVSEKVRSSVLSSVLLISTVYKYTPFRRIHP